MFSNQFSTLSPPSLTASGTQSTTTTPSATSNGTTPRFTFQTPPNDTSTLDTLFEEAELSPPSKSSECLLSEVITTANEILLEAAHLRRWEELSSYERVQLAFLIFKKQPSFLLLKHKGDRRAAALELLGVFDEKTNAHKALAAFLWRGGDKHHEECDKYWIRFLGKHSEWMEENESTYSLFTCLDSFGKPMTPFLRFQTPISNVCFVVSAANAILYYMQRTTGTSREVSLRQYAINVGRFMRNNFTDDQTFQIIFCDNGGYPHDVLECMLTHSITPRAKQRKTTIINFFPQVNTTFDTMRCYLETGPILVCDFRVFSAYLDINRTEFHGDWNELKEDGQNKLHAFLIVGVRKTENGDMGGLQFLVQDSFPGRPFITIGWDLFRTMGVRELHVILEDVVFHGTTKENELMSIPIVSCLTSGSPRHALILPEDAISSEHVGIGECFTSSSSEDDTTNGTRLDFIGFDGVDENTDLSKLVIYS